MIKELCALYGKKGPLGLDDLWDNASFCAQRPKILQEILAMKKLRRVFLGDHFTFLFEHRLLLWWQTQEMLRTEKGGTEQALEELEAYNPLMPDLDGTPSFSLTLMIEFKDEIERKRHLHALIGIEHTVSLGFQSIQGEIRAWAHPILFPQIYQSNEEKTCSVHFLSIPMPEKEAFLASESPPVLCVSHPHCSVEAPLSEALFQSLKQEMP
jgi:hypothetical protein